tara:strand:+ start:157 stop:360 length:204 start_codon:yes stop_codon:yes gene_type:complete
MIAAKIAGKKPSTVNPSKNEDANQIRAALITKENSPSVKIVIGNVKKWIIGRIIALIRPRTTAAMSA